MNFFRSLNRLWRHPLFRKLVAVRIATQASDGTLQVAMAAYVLFSPQQQPDAASIAAVTAVTLLPYSLVGPFVSLTLDRFDRRQVAVVTDALRVVLALMLGVLVLNPELREHWSMWLFYGGVLVAMSLNRYLLAGLSAALPHTVDQDEYLMASSVMPTIGPAGVVIGGAVAAGVRITLSGVLETYQADAIVFCVAAAGFAITVVLSLQIRRGQLGPDLDSAEAATTSSYDVLRGLAHALVHLRERVPAGMGLATIGAQRVVYGMTQVATILVFRNHFHHVTEVDAAMKDMAIWMGATGAGFVLSAALVPPIAHRIGVRRTMIVLLVASGIVQIVPGSLFTVWTLVAAGFLLGLCAQSLKICVDTLVQAHIDDDFKGRVFTVYDMIFNACLVVAAVLTAWFFPANGHTVTGFVTLGVLFVVTALVFALASRRIDARTFNRGSDNADAGIQPSAEPG